MLKKIVLSIFILFLLACGLFAQTVQTVTLKPGFNFIGFTASISSTPTQLKAQNSTIEDIYLFSAAAGSFLSATEGTLSTLTAGKGYIIKSSAVSDTVINILGDAVQTIGNINLKTGFNLIGFSKIPSTTVSFSSLMNVYSTIKGIYKWSPAAGSFIQVVRDNGGTVTLLDGADPSFKAGESYFFNLTEDTTINYDGSTIILGNGPPAPIAKTLELTGTVGASPATASPSYSLARAIDLSTMNISVYDEINNSDVEGAAITATGSDTFKATLPVATADRYLSVLVKNSDNKVVYKTFLGRVPKATEVTENTVKISNIKVSDESTARAIIILENRTKIPITAVIAKKSVDTSINNTEFALALEEHIAGLEDRVPELKQAVNLIANVLTTPGVDNAIKEKVTEFTFSESSKLLSSYVSLLQDTNTLQTVNNISVPTQLYIGSKQITAQSTQVDIYETVTGINDTIGQRAEMPVLDPPPGNYNSAIAVKMTCATPNANIIYDYGDGNPGITYTGPVAINKTCKLNVAAFRSDWPMSWHSKFVNATYTIGPGSGETTETQTLVSISLDKTAEAIVVTTEKYYFSNIKITAYYSNGDSKEVQATRWEMVSSPGIFSDMDNSYLPWGKIGEAIFNAVYSENGIEKRAEFKLKVMTQAEIENTLASIKLNKTEDSINSGASYDLAQIKAIANYLNGTTKEVTIEWSKISGSGIYANFLYNTSASTEIALFKASYFEGGKMASANFTLTISSTYDPIIIERVTKSITSAGDCLRLKNGINFEIPPDSVSTTTSVTIKQMKVNTDVNRNINTFIIKTDNPISNCMIIVPSPSGANSDYFSATLVDKNYNLTPLTVVIENSNYKIDLSNTLVSTPLTSNISKMTGFVITDETTVMIEQSTLILEPDKTTRYNSNDNKIINCAQYYQFGDTCYITTWLSLMKSYRMVLDSDFDTVYKIAKYYNLTTLTGPTLYWATRKYNLIYRCLNYIVDSEFKPDFVNECQKRYGLSVEEKFFSNKFSCVIYAIETLSQKRPLLMAFAGHILVVVGYDLNGQKFTEFLNNIDLTKIKLIVNDITGNDEASAFVTGNKYTIYQLYEKWGSSIGTDIITYSIPIGLPEDNVYQTIEMPPSSGIVFKGSPREEIVWNIKSTKGLGLSTEKDEIQNELNGITLDQISIGNATNSAENVTIEILIKDSQNGLITQKMFSRKLVPYSHIQIGTEKTEIIKVEEFVDKIKPSPGNFNMAINLLNKNNKWLDGFDVDFKYRKLFIEPQPQGALPNNKRRYKILLGNEAIPLKNNIKATITPNGTYEINEINGIEYLDVTFDQNASGIYDIGVETTSSLIRTAKASINFTTLHLNITTPNNLVEFGNRSILQAILDNGQTQTNITNLVEWQINNGIPVKTLENQYQFIPNQVGKNIVSIKLLKNTKLPSNDIISEDIEAKIELIVYKINADSYTMYAETQRELLASVTGISLNDFEWTINNRTEYSGQIVNEEGKYFYIPSPNSKIYYDSNTEDIITARSKSMPSVFKEIKITIFRPLKKIVKTINNMYEYECVSIGTLGGYITEQFLYYHGYYKMWYYSTDKIRIEGNYDKGHKTGIWKGTYSSGLPCYEGQYVNDIKVPNTWKFWTSEGKETSYTLDINEDTLLY